MNSLKHSEKLKPVILLVDDDPINLLVLTQLLEDAYRVVAADGGLACIEKAHSAFARPALILLDIMMPQMDGFEVCQRLKDDPQTSDIPVIFVSAKIDANDEERGLALGAVDFIHKPISPPILLARVATHLALKEQADMLRNRNDALEHLVQERTREIVAVQDAAIFAMALLAEVSDAEILNHLRRVQHYVVALAQTVRDRPRFAGQLPQSAIDTLFRSVPLHDIGNAGVPDRVLLKPGRLSASDIETMNLHAVTGLDVLEQAERATGGSLAFLNTAKDIVLSHHERWDGKGYPKGLMGEAIPLAARLVAIADVYDALITHKVYKEGKSHHDAMQIIYQERGAHFDPDLVDAFVEIQEEIAAIAARYPDTEEGMQKKIDYMIRAIAEDA